MEVRHIMEVIYFPLKELYFFGYLLPVFFVLLSVFHTLQSQEQLNP